jgi:hypothetical protein
MSKDQLTIRVMDRGEIAVARVAAEGWNPPEGQRMSRSRRADRNAQSLSI